MNVQRAYDNITIQSCRYRCRENKIDCELCSPVRRANQLVLSSVRCVSSQQQNQLAVVYEGCRRAVKIQYSSSNVYYDYSSMCGPGGTRLRAGSAWAFCETTRDEVRAGPDRSNRCSATIATQWATHPLSHPPRAPRGLDPWAVCCSGVPTWLAVGLVPLHRAYQETRHEVA